MAAVIGTLKLKISSGKGRRVYGHPEATCGSSKEHQKSREGGKTKTNFKTFAEENATSARATGREGQTITTLSMKRDQLNESSNSLPIIDGHRTWPQVS